MERMCDLHTHSYYSDGTNSPAELITLAVEAGLSAVALCDHNTAAGLPEFLEAARGTGVEAVPGMEFSADWRGTELHILGLFINEGYYDRLADYAADFQQRKDRSNRALVDALARDGYRVDYDALAAGAPDGYINRAHIAAALTRAGYTASIQEAFKKLLSQKAGYYVPPRLPDAMWVLDLIRQMGAVPVLAHPFLNLDEAGLRAFLPAAIEHGLAAMETRYSKYAPETAALAARIAKEYGIGESGGSDYHGDNKPDIRMGIGRGDLQIPERFLQQLKTLKLSIINSQFSSVPAEAIRPKSMRKGSIYGK